VVATRLLLTMAGVAVAAALAGCGQGTLDPAPAVGPTLRAPATTSLTTADPQASTEQEVLAAYRGMWAAYDRAGSPPAADHGHPSLALYATGDALLVLVDGLRSLQDQGLVTEGEVALFPEVTHISLDTTTPRARVEDCADTTASFRVRADGTPFEDEPGGRRMVTAQLEESAGIWKVIRFTVREVGSC
jgi:hypothetical protein